MAAMKVVPQMLIIAGVSVLSLAGDTVTLRNNKSYNGMVASLSPRGLRIEGNFEGKSNGMDVPLASISALEFNDIVDNAGTAPAFGAHESKAEPQNGPVQKRTAVELQNDVLVLLGGQRVKCAVTSIDKKNVRCGDIDYERERIYRIEFKRR